MMIIRTFEPPPRPGHKDPPRHVDKRPHLDSPVTRHGVSVQPRIVPLGPSGTPLTLHLPSSTNGHAAQPKTIPRSPPNTTMDNDASRSAPSEKAAGKVSLVPPPR